jgi:phosphinothricin acetyltransferase
MASVTAIYAHFVETSTATFDLVAPGQATILRRQQLVAESGLPYLVAELEGFIVGYSYASPFRPREGYRFTVEDSIYVRADCIGYGVGKLLLSELIRQCQAKIGTLPEAGKKFGQWLDLTIMQRLLGQPLV